MDNFGEHHAAMELIDEGEKRLGELQRKIETDSSDEMDIRKLFHESQFALEQAMKSLPRNRRATEMNRELLLVMARYEILAGRLDMAKALGSKISPPCPELQLELAGLARQKLEQQHEHGRLQALDRDTSVEISMKQRSTIHIAMAAGSLLAGAVGIGLHLTDIPIWTPFWLLVMMIALLGLLSAGIAIGRRELFSTKLNRGICLTLLAWAGSLCVNRALGMAHDLPVPDILTTDMMLSAMAATVCGLTVRPPYLWCGLAFLLGTFVSATALVPSPLAWVGSLVTAFVLAAVAEFRLGMDIPDEKSSESATPLEDK